MRIAVIQMNAEPDVEANLAIIRKYIASGAANGADLVVFPEAAMFPFDHGRLDTVAQPLDGPFAQAVIETAQEHGTTAVVGMFTPADTVFRTPAGDIVEELPEGSGEANRVNRVHNTLLVAGPNGVTHYNKIHTYDAFGYRESDTVKPGDRRVVVDVADTTIGLATCYDIRFPGHFAALASAGAKVMIVPSSWADGPGKLDQWRTLTMARALDSASYLVAAGMARPGSPDRYGYADGPTGIGHSVAIGPNGARLAETGYAAQVLTVDIDPNRVDKIRETVPVLAGHRTDLEIGEGAEHFEGV
ncbi:carbon-nitrogen hydrolase family protein [Corynebacterium sp. 320]|uniref:Carbon-nitrogen hydrolase family protein n=1 Tax=Corynebacterium zhongnanshanii TaxID=2768834 RepID=A0ABQ6VCH8_9CORY|nr:MULTISPECIES: carbon-nitrogen hydrolase family protein [Corynebacterium]KAB1503131.1 carbon-nitrogen hydrolase family protein [Corynebacterium sp. 320]KAB1550655.1 carbon-nitrogen hydrolase family protein [Corynebacterium sp. 321]KAB1551017.1 carbon-nitrogen hydrolase family protein [Corynebacterium sp. 319]KAB3519929.1 carbon-nitrogen hydrolase family protein [Corynebacterium zhongnanshanii]KAB3526928.1 carbon-nitrogen hydrolase family protein [Corynebacterium sp. 250]